MAPAPHRVLAAADAWVWVPPDAHDEVTPEYRLTFYPGRAAVAWSRTERPLAEVVAEVAERSRAVGLPRLRWWVTPSSRPASTQAQLTALGFRPGEELEVLACDLAADGERILSALHPPSDVEVTPADDLAALEAGARIGAAAFGDEPTRAQLEHAAAAARTGLASGRWTTRQYLALIGGEPVAHGGCSLAEGVTRLWGGTVLPAWRGRGAYRALVAERCRLGLEQDAPLALVKARPRTSGPILRRAGFEAYGSERAYDLALTAPG